MPQWKKLWILALPLLLSGCMMSATAESLYALPRPPEEYESLSIQLSEILAGGAEYAPPQTGGNLPPVQRVDLDGDGSKEVLAFFRISSEERPLKIYIFQASGDNYQLRACIEGSGTSIHSIRYVDMDGDGVQELIVSWSVGADLQALGVYSLQNMEQPVQLMTTSYARYEVVDLDGDDHQELTVLRSDDAETGASLADYYDWEGGGLLQLRSTARLSASVAALQWMQVGTLHSGETAVFVTSRTTGVDETPRAVTDILVWRQMELENIVLSSDTGVSTQIARSSNLQPADVDGDGATEIPIPVELPAEEGGDPCWKVYWHGFQANGESQIQALTYHNLTDRWYLLIPFQWDGHFTVRQNNAGSSAHATTFYSVNGRTTGEELFTIYTLTGTDRESQAVKGDRAILRRRTAPDTVYAITYSEAYDSWSYAVDRKILADGFNVITSPWSMGEN